jgi:phosphomethylpyrimidine synthase
MELTQQVRDYARDKGLEESTAAEVGMQEKSLEFRRGRELYVPLDKERVGI